MPLRAARKSEPGVMRALFSVERFDCNDLRLIYFVYAERLILYPE